MRWKFEDIFRSFIIILLAILLWSVWRTEAQSNTDVTTKSEGALVVAANLPEAGKDSGTNAPVVTPPPKWVRQLTGQFPVLRTEIWENELWKYLFSLGYIFLAFYISKFLDYLTRIWLKRWAARTKPDLTTWCSIC